MHESSTAIDIHLSFQFYIFCIFLWSATPRHRRCTSGHHWPNYMLRQHSHSLLDLILSTRNEVSMPFCVPSWWFYVYRFVITYFTEWRQLRCRGNNVTVFIIFSIIVVILWISGLIQITSASVMQYTLDCNYMTIFSTWFSHGIKFSLFTRS